MEGRGGGLRLLAAASAAVLLAGHASAAEPAGARAFMDEATDFALHDYTGPAAPHYRALFTLRLNVAMDLDASAGEIRVANDGEVICGCQDNEGLTMHTVSVTGDARAALAKVQRQWPGGGGNVATFRLIREGGKWRIADVKDSTGVGDGTKQAWLLPQLDRSNAQLLAERARHRRR
jgi:hypothetical protein